jgi:nicotinamidase-related amidase
MRDAGQLGYFPFMIKEGVSNNGPPFTQESAMFNIKLAYGWVTSVDDILKLLNK